MNYLDPYSHFIAKEEGKHQQPTSRQVQAMTEYQRRYIEQERARDFPAIREERNSHVQNWGIA